MFILSGRLTSEVKEQDLDWFDQLERDITNKKEAPTLPGGGGPQVIIRVYYVSKEVVQEWKLYSDELYGTYFTKLGSFTGENNNDSVLALALCRA